MNCKNCGKELLAHTPARKNYPDTCNAECYQQWFTRRNALIKQMLAEHKAKKATA